jgi:hypothetical protein
MAVTFQIKLEYENREKDAPHPEELKREQLLHLGENQE